MANVINIPSLNAIKLVSMNLIIDYNAPNFEEALFENQIFDFQTKKSYSQKFQKNDPLYFQFNANFAPISAKLVDCNNVSVQDATITTVTTASLPPTYVAYGASFNLSIIPEGTYWVKLFVGDGACELIAISEPIEVADLHENTILLEYTHSENAKGLIFQNNETFYFRVEAALLEFQPGSEDVVADDEPGNLVTLSSTIFRTWKLYIGKGAGVPDWIADKIIRIFSCDKVLLNGKQFTKPEGSKLDRAGNINSPLSGWKLDVRESQARDGLTIQNNIPLNEHISLIYITKTSFFGTLGAVTNSIIIKDE